MFIRGFFRLFYYIFVAYMIFSVYRFVIGLGRKRPAAKDPARLSGIMVKDETCQIYLPRENAFRETVDGREYFFCSKECRKKFFKEGQRPVGQ